MIHLGCTEPELFQTLPVYLYRYQALRTLRQAIDGITESNISAARGASILLATVSFAMDNDDGDDDGDDEKYSGTLRRATMELTRLIAALRPPPD
ncbi:hypothetical protein ACJ41O_000711 [Fusarium nematophilum]